MLLLVADKVQQLVVRPAQAPSARQASRVEAWQLRGCSKGLTAGVAAAAMISSAHLSPELDLQYMRTCQSEWMVAAVGWGTSRYGVMRTWLYLQLRLAATKRLAALKIANALSRLDCHGSEHHPGGQGGHYTAWVRLELHEWD